jgi:hypothetical protein
MIYVIAIIVALALVFLWWLKRARAPQLSKGDRNKYEALWNDVVAIDDGYRQIIAADALCAKALTAAGVKGSMGEQLKAIDTWYPRINNIWRAHKLRNKLAHEPSATLTKRDQDHAMAEFKFLLQSL